MSLKNLVFHPVSAFASALLCSSCAASSLDLGAEAQPLSPAEVQSKEDARQPDNPPDDKLVQTALAPLRAIHPGRMRVLMDHASRTLTVEVSFDPCKPGDFVYAQNSLDVVVDPFDRSVTLKGVVEYIEQVPSDPATCENRPDPIVFVSENAEPGPYLIANRSAWMGRGGNGLKARVMDFRTPAQMETDRQDCLSQDRAELGHISGVWFLQSDPANAMTLSGNASAMTPDDVLRTWVGSYRPWVIESDAPYSFNLPSFGYAVFQSSSCALIYTPNKDKPTDFLIRQTPGGQ